MVAALGLLPLALGPAAPLEAQSATLPLIGRSDLGGAGFNSAVAIVGTTAIIGAGIVPAAGIHAQLYAPLPCPAVSVKVVSLADPVRPKVVAQIPMPEGVVAQDVSAQREIAHFAPPDRTDPQGTFPAKATVVGVAMLDSGGRQYVVITDVNSGLYVLATPRAKR